MIYLGLLLIPALLLSGWQVCILTKNKIKMTTQEIITDEQINNAWGNASFGKNVSKRDVVANALLKYASEYGTGYTIEQICKDLGLITKQCKLNTLGKQYLYEAYRNGLSV